MRLLVCLVLFALVCADVTVEQARAKRAAFEASAAAKGVFFGKRATAPVVNGTTYYMVPRVGISTPALTCGQPDVEYCLVEMILYDGVGISSVKTELLETPPDVLAPRPPSGIALNPFYAGGFPFNGGCESGVTIYDPARTCCPIGAVTTSVWDPTQGYLSQWVGQPCNGTNGCTAGACPDCAGYSSQVAPDPGTLTVPLMQLSFNNMTGNGVRFKVLLTDRDQVEYPFDACCGCTCTTVANPRAPLECNAPFDFDAEILPNNVGILTQEGFQSISLNASNVTGNATFFAGASGYTVRVVRGDYAYNNNFMNTNPSTPSNLLLDGLGHSTGDFAGFTISTLQAGTWRVRVWIFDQALNGTLANQNIWFQPYNLALGPNVGINIPNPTPFVGPFSPQPFPYDSQFSYGNNSGPAAAEFFVNVDGVSTYQLLVRGDCAGIPGNGRVCASRINGFQFILQDRTPPVLTCNDTTLFIEACNGTITWCDPLSISDNCPLDFPGFNPVMQVSGPVKGSVVPIGIYDVGYKGMDLSMNSGFCSFKVYLLDRLAPTLNATCFPPIVVNVTDGLCCGIVNFTNPPANTNCDSALNYTYTPYGPGSCFPIGTTIVTLVVDDIVNRAATCQFSVTVLDNRPPPVVCVPPLNVTLPCGPAFQYYQQNAGLAKSTDNCPLIAVPNRTAVFCGASAVRECFTWDVISPPGSGLSTSRGCFETSSASCQCSFLLGLNVTVNATSSNATVVIWGQDVNAGVCSQFVSGTPPYTITYFPQTDFYNVTTIVTNSATTVIGPFTPGYYGLIVTDSRGLTNSACFQILPFKLVVLLALLLACARGQFEDDAELQELLSQIANEPLSFPDPMPVTVGRNAMSPLSRFAATSALPVWSLALLGFSGAVALVALAALIFSIVSKDLGKNRTFGIVFSVVLLVAAAAGIAVALGVGYTMTAPSTGLQPGSRFVIENGVTRVVSTSQGNLWRVVLLSPDGNELTTFYPVQDAGLPMSDARSGDGTSLPPVNSIISASVFVTHDGKVLFESWAVKTAATAGRVAQVTGTKRVAAYRVAFTTNDCGGGTACNAICSESEIRTLMMTGRQSVNNFYTTVSGGLFSFDSLDVYDVSVDPSKVKTFSTLAAVGKKTGDYHIMFFPPNTGWDAFSGGAAGYGGVGDVSSWIKACNFPTVGHEMAHNYGLHHAGARDQSGNWVEYGDASSVMGSAYLANWDESNRGAPAPGLGWVGLSAAQMYQNGWLPDEAVLKITRNGVYEIPNSLSSNRGVRCAKLSTSPELWLEWREGVNQDVDLRYTQMFFDRSKHRNADGRVMTALLAKTFLSDRKSSLEGFVQAGGTLRFGSVTISRAAGSRPGTFVINGLAGDSVTVPTAPVTTTTTTTTRWIPDSTTTTTRGSSGGGSTSVSLVCATGTANIRSQPSTSGSPIGSARSGESFQLVSTTGSWSQVRRSCTGSTMYISSSLLRSCGSTPCGGGAVTNAPTSTPTSNPNTGTSSSLMCSTTNANKRSQPSTSGSVVGSAPSGTSMVLIETSGSWTRLRDCGGSSTFWISSSLLRSCGTSTTC